MHSSRMRTARLLTVSQYLVVSVGVGDMHARHIPCHAFPLPCMPPAMHAPRHAFPLPCMPPAMHIPLPCIPPYHACPHHACPLPCIPPAMHAPCHAHPPAMHTPLPCMPPTTQTPLPRVQTDTCKNITFANFVCGRLLSAPICVMDRNYKRVH